MGIKVAVSGKGGVGKTTIAGLLARRWAVQGKCVLAVDADPVNHLSAVLGIPKGELPTPLSKMSALIEERTGVAPGDSFGKLFRMNPRVDDIPEKFSAKSADGVRLIVLGTIQSAGSGCFCPENALLRTLIDHLVLSRDDYLVVDMEAGLEHLGRGSSRGLDLLLLVVEPGQRSIETAERIRELASEMGIKRTAAILNRVSGSSTAAEVGKKLADLGIELLGAIPYDETLLRADSLGVPPFTVASTSPAMDAISKIADDLQRNR